MRKVYDLLGVEPTLGIVVAITPDLTFRSVHDAVGTEWVELVKSTPSPSSSSSFP